jgi:hypothetical protein
MTPVYLLTGQLDTRNSEDQAWWTPSEATVQLSHPTAMLSPDMSTLPNTAPSPSTRHQSLNHQIAAPPSQHLPNSASPLVLRLHKLQKPHLLHPKTRRSPDFRACGSLDEARQARLLVASSSLHSIPCDQRTLLSGVRLTLVEVQMGMRKRNWHALRHRRLSVVEDRRGVDIDLCLREMVRWGGIVLPLTLLVLDRG